MPVQSSWKEGVIDPGNLPSKCGNSPSAHQLTSEGELAKVNAPILYEGLEGPVTISCSGDGVKVLNLPNFAWEKNANGPNIFASFGGDQPHNTLQPLFGAYKFRRTN